MGGLSPDVITKLVGGFAVTLLGVATLPFLMVPGAGGPDVAASGPNSCGQLGIILGTIRTVETGSNYDSRISTATASGAYAFIDATWRSLAPQAGVDTDH